MVGLRGAADSVEQSNPAQENKGQVGRERFEVEGFKGGKVERNKSSAVSA